MVGLIDDFVERQRIGPLAAVATAQGARLDLAEELEYFQGDRETTWWRMIAALSLVELGREEHLRTMIDAMNTGTLAGQYVPSLLLDPELIDREQVIEALHQTALEGSLEERETVGWMLPYLDRQEVGEVLEILRDDPEASVRRAARWASGELERQGSRPGPGAGRGEAS